MATNWNLLQMPDIGAAFQQGQEMRRQSDGRNALAAYAANPNEQSLNALSPYNPQFVVQTKRQDQQFQLEQQKLTQKTHGEQMQVLGRLIAPVKDEASYQQALAAARQGGLDISAAPPTFDPQFIGRTKLLVDAYNKDGGVQLSGLARELQDAGYQPGTPAFQEAMGVALQGKYAPQYTDQQGNLRQGKLPSLPSTQAVQIIPTRPAGVDDAELFRQAQEAVANGADRNTVFEQLQAWGVKP